ncbi:MAG: T9SS type A sorting domain-containing protein [Bacteroidota bacterium]
MTIQPPLFVALIITFALGGIVVAPRACAQTTLTRSVISGGGGTVSDSAHHLRGTLSQTAAGRAIRNIDDRHDAGFWYWAYRPEFVAHVSIPHLQAEVGTRLTVPIHLSVSGTRRPFLPRAFHARISFNHTLLRAAGSTPACTSTDHNCTLEIDGTATTMDGNIAELEFIAVLGDSESTALTIEEFEWTKSNDERIATVREPGVFDLLGVCRAGGEIRLIRSGAFASRLRVWPNPVADRATMEFVAAESGPVSIRLVDLLGNDVARLAAADAEAERLYSSEIDLRGIPSGPYMLVYTTPTAVMTQRLLITR